MKKIISLLTMVALLFAIPFSIPVYAAETITEKTDEAVMFNDSEDTLVPNGTLSGYGQKWHDPASDGTSGKFSFRVSGSDWYVGHLTVSLENFSDDTKLDIRVFSPITNSDGENQVIFYRKGVCRSDGPWEDISFNPATTGTYTVTYSISGSNTPGRVNCWIY